MRKLLQRLKIIVIIHTISLVLIGCKHKSAIKEDNKFLFSEFPIEDTLSFNNISEYKAGAAGMMKLVDSTLIIFNVNQGANYFLQNFSIKNRKYSKGYLKNGKGPGEAIGGSGIGIIGDSLWMLDVTLKRILSTAIGNGLSDNPNYPFTQFAVKQDYYMIGFKDYQHYFGVGSEKSLFKIQEVDLSSGNVINEYGKYEKASEEMDLRALKAAHECFIHVKPSREKLVLAYRFTDAIEIFDTKTYKSIFIHGPERFDAEGESNGSHWYRTNKTRFAFVSGGGTVTNKFIYMLYSGSFTSNRNLRYANCIYVYDWDGNPIRKLVLDKQIEGLVVSEDDKMIYAYDVNSGYIMRSSIN